MLVKNRPQVALSVPIAYLVELALRAKIAKLDNTVDRRTIQQCATLVPLVKNQPMPVPCVKDVILEKLALHQASAPHAQTTSTLICGGRRHASPALPERPPTIFKADAKSQTGLLSPTAKQGCNTLRTPLPTNLIGSAPLARLALTAPDIVRGSKSSRCPATTG